MKTQKSFCFFTGIIIIIIILVAHSHSPSPIENEVQNNSSNIKDNFTSIKNGYPIHKDITVTVFWVGERSGIENGFISNKESAWDEDWEYHFGGEDTPDNRDGYYPADFTPKENPFYFALPYNDFTDRGIRKENSVNIYWGSEKEWGREESICKNRWIEIMHGNRIAYAQWEDTGPFEYDDVGYVFGTNEPKNKLNQNAGLDVSPAVSDYLGLNGMDKVDWQFVDFEDVPEGPWKVVVTSS